MNVSKNIRCVYLGPWEAARRVAAAFGAGAEVLEHAGGHVVPLDAGALAAYARVMGVALGAGAAAGPGPGAAGG